MVDRKVGSYTHRVAGALAAGFVVLLLATELVLTLPDETDRRDCRELLCGASDLHHHLAAHRNGGGRIAGDVRLAVAYGRSVRRGCRHDHGGLQLRSWSHHDHDCDRGEPRHPAAAGRWNGLEPRATTSCRGDRTFAVQSRCGLAEASGPRVLAAPRRTLLPSSSQYWRQREGVAARLERSVHCFS